MGIRIVVIDAMELHRRAVNQQFTFIRNTNSSKANFLGDYFSVPFQFHGIQVRFLCIPENWAVNLKRCIRGCCLNS